MDAKSSNAGLAELREDNVSVGGLDLLPGSIVAFRTDAIYTTVERTWPYQGHPGDYLLKDRIPEPVTTPTSDEEFFALQAAGRARYEADQSAGAQ